MLFVGEVVGSNEETFLVDHFALLHCSIHPRPHHGQADVSD